MRAKKIDFQVSMPEEYWAKGERVAVDVVLDERPDHGCFEAFLMRFGTPWYYLQRLGSVIIT